MTIYYVDGAVGNDTNLGTSEGAGNAWATIAKAAASVLAGDLVYIKASATYAETVNLGVAGAYNNPIFYIGYSSTISDRGKVTVDGTGQTNCLTATSAGGIYHRFQNFIFSGATGDGVLLTADNCSWVNCEFNSNGGDGIDVDNDHYFYNCVAHSNGAYGFDTDNSTKWIGCIAHDNVGYQFFSGQPQGVHKCIAYGPGASTSHMFGLGSMNCHITNCIVDGGGGAGRPTGFYCSSTNDTTVIDCIVVGCDTGVAMSNTSNASDTVSSNNLFFDNTKNWATVSGTIIGSAPGFTHWTSTGEVNGDPLFTDDTTADYTLTDSSPAIDAGLLPGGIT